MQVAARDFAYQSHIDAQVEALTLEGVDLIQTANGLTLSLHGAEGFMSFAKFRGQVFHYNSTQTIAAHVST